MKTNKDLIAKYLSGLLSDEEKIQFEEKLTNDSILRKDLEKYYKFNELELNKIQLDEKYFVNLLPRTREKIRSRSKSKSHKLAVGIPSLVISILIVFILSKNNIKEINSYSEEFFPYVNDSQVVQQYITDIDETTKETYYNLIVNEEPFLDIADENEKEKLLTIYDSLIDDYYQEFNLSQNDLNSIISKIDLNKSK